MYIYITICVGICCVKRRKTRRAIHLHVVIVWWRSVRSTRSSRTQRWESLETRWPRDPSLRFSARLSDIGVWSSTPQSPKCGKCPETLTLDLFFLSLFFISSVSVYHHLFLIPTLPLPSVRVSFFLLYPPPPLLLRPLLPLRRWGDLPFRLLLIPNEASVIFLSHAQTHIHTHTHTLNKKRGPFPLLILLVLLFIPLVGSVIALAVIQSLRRSLSTSVSLFLFPPIPPGPYRLNTLPLLLHLPLLRLLTRFLPPPSLSSVLCRVVVVVFSSFTTFYFLPLNPILESPSFVSIYSASHV